MNGNGGDDSGNLIQSINGWFLHPFNSQGNALFWVWTVGFVVIIVFLWNLVLLEFLKEV